MSQDWERISKHLDQIPSKEDKVIEHQTIHRFALSPKLYAQLRNKFNSNENPVVIEEVKTNTILEIWRIE